jgi:integrase
VSHTLIRRAAVRAPHGSPFTVVRPRARAVAPCFAARSGTTSGATPNQRRGGRCSRTCATSSAGSSAALERNPCDFIRTPRKREPARGELFTGDERAAIFTANRASVTRRRSASSWTSPYGRARSGGSNSAITTWSRRRHCKGARAHTLPVPAGAQVILERHPTRRVEADQAGRDYRDEFLLCPAHRGPKMRGPQRDPDSGVVLFWDDRLRPEMTLHMWWGRVLERAGVRYRRMHEARHTALTEFQRAQQDVPLTQLLAGHKSIQTTADMCLHVDVDDLAWALRRQSEERGERFLHIPNPRSGAG